MPCPDGAPVRCLVVNAGSSTLKLSVLDEGSLVATEDLEAPGGRPGPGAISGLIDRFGPFDVAGHRVVHGGQEFVEPVLVDDEVVRKLQALTPLAPVHQGGTLAGLAAVSEKLPHVPAVACFDTAFHASLAPPAYTYALPEAWRKKWGLRRYGFHGLSHAYASRRAAEMAGDRPEKPASRPLRVITCHLGSGSSLAAVEGGACVDTTMGFTPLEGLVMGTRSGTVDPGLVLWLAQEAGLSPGEISDQLEHASGLLGLAGTADMREVLAAEEAGDERASLAIAVYVHRLTALVCSMAAALGGLDVLVFTGGVGEHAAPVRARAARRLDFLGVALDEGANQAAQSDADITAAGAPVRALVITAREDLEIARGARQVLERTQLP